MNDIDQQLHDNIEYLVAVGEIDQASDAYGVARQVIHQGYDSLTPKQRALYEAVVVPALSRHAAEIEANRIQNSNPP